MWCESEKNTIQFNVDPDQGVNPGFLFHFLLHDRAFFNILNDFTENNLWILMKKCRQGTVIYECVQFGAYPNNYLDLVNLIGFLRRLLGLRGGMCSTECHSSYSLNSIELLRFQGPDILFWLSVTLSWLTGTLESSRTISDKLIQVKICLFLS